MHKPNKRLLWLWETYMGLLLLVLAGLTVLLLLLPIPSWIGWSFGGLALAVYLFYAALYLPMVFRRKSYGIVNGRLVVKGGLIYAYNKTMPLESIKYVMTIRGPLEYGFKLTYVAVFAAGSFIFLSGLTPEEGEAFRRQLFPGMGR